MHLQRLEKLLDFIKNDKGDGFNISTWQTCAIGRAVAAGIFADEGMVMERDMMTTSYPVYAGAMGGSAVYAFFGITSEEFDTVFIACAYGVERFDMVRSWNDDEYRRACFKAAGVVTPSMVIEKLSAFIEAEKERRRQVIIDDMKSGMPMSDKIKAIIQRHVVGASKASEPSLALAE